jgi:trehalose-phosphatase
VQSDQLPSALAHWENIRERSAGRKPAVFLDYDGTLTAIVSRPELAVLPEEMRATVRRLAENVPVAVVSGRDLDDVRALVAIDGIFYAGSHGYQLEGPGWRLELPQAAGYLRDLERAEAALRTELDNVAGALVERKRFAVVAHYRLVAEADQDRLVEAVERTAQAFPRLRRTGGKKVFELLPNMDWDKGKALRWLAESMKLDPARHYPLFLGDDITDENAFAAVRNSGVGVIVRDEPRETQASFALDSIDEVKQFLGRLVRQP